ncbi:MAG: 6-phospho-3-hexuloisomerase [Planctomycetota bacterium]|nr:6-phospho-3-hexuloisomerase [Planctomycetota bacterium]
MSEFLDALREIGKELSDCLSKVSVADALQAIEQLVIAERVYVAGAGRSGLVMRAFGMRLMHLGKPVHVVGETTTPAMTGNDLLIIGSGSGSTPSLLLAANKARKLGSRIILITADPESVIALVAETVVKINARTPKAESTSGNVSVQPMGNLFEQSLFILLDAIAIALMPRLGETEESMFERHANVE